MFVKPFCAKMALIAELHAADHQAKMIFAGLFSTDKTPQQQISMTTV
jgi:hypothetical protein